MSDLLYKIKNRRGLAADWLLADPVLSAGEFGIESDTGKIKVGDGSLVWSELAYVTDHDHDEVYAAIGHDHDEAYAGIAHDEGGGSVAPAPDVWRVPGVPIGFPDAFTFTNLGVSGGSWKFNGAVLHPNGLIYLFPGDLNPTAYEIGILDPVTETYRAVNIADPAGPGTDLWGKKYLAATLGKDGLIYVIPQVWDEKILIFDPDTEITTVQAVSITSGGPIDPDTEGNKYLSSVICASNGRLWCIPGDRTTGSNCSHVIVIDPSDFTASAYENTDIYGWGRSILAGDGLIYASPSCDARILRIDPVWDSISTDDIDLSGAGSQMYGDIIEDQFGRIWVPEFAGSSTVGNKLAVYDPHDLPYQREPFGRVYAITLPAPWYDDPAYPPNEASAAYMLSGFQRSVLAKNGLIYCVNSRSVQYQNDVSNPWGFYVLEIDPFSLVKDPDTLTATVNTRYLFIQEGSSQKVDAIGGLLNLPDGRVIGIPAKDGFDKFMVLDPCLHLISGDGLISAHINKI